LGRLQPQLGQFASKQFIQQFPQQPWVEWWPLLIPQRRQLSQFQRRRAAWISLNFGKY
jgi:hypothetical protein